MAAYDVLSETRMAIEEIAANMLFIKMKMKSKNPNPNNSKSELKELITDMSLLFIALRKVNRTILLEEDCVKAQNGSAKARMDFASLQLHNLMYEKNHYIKAIQNCKNFKSKYPDIHLVPEEEFFSSAPEDIKGKALANDSAHDLMLKRLTFELFQRKGLCKLQEKLEQRKGGLLETRASRKKFLSSLPSQLKSLKKASLPVQQQLGIPDAKKLKQHIAADLLPPPHYTVYSQLLAQKEAFGERIELEIVGSVKDAQTFAQQQANNKNGPQLDLIQRTSAALEPELQQRLAMITVPAPPKHVTSNPVMAEMIMQMSSSTFGTLFSAPKLPTFDTFIATVNGVAQLLSVQGADVTDWINKMRVVGEKLLWLQKAAEIEQSALSTDNASALAMLNDQIEVEGLRCRKLFYALKKILAAKEHAADLRNRLREKVRELEVQLEVAKESLGEVSDIYEGNVTLAQHAEQDALNQQRRVAELQQERCRVELRAQQVLAAQQAPREKVWEVEII